MNTSILTDIRSKETHLGIKLDHNKRMKDFPKEMIKPHVHTTTAYENRNK